MTYQAKSLDYSSSTFDRTRMSGLLRRYPRITDMEVREILNFMKTAQHLDVGLLTSDESIRPMLDAFMDDHRSHFRLKIWEGGMLFGVMAVVLVIAWMVSESF